MEQFKQTVDTLKEFVKNSCGKAEIRLKTNDGFIVTISVKEDDGTMDMEEPEYVDDEDGYEEDIDKDD